MRLTGYLDVEGTMLYLSEEAYKHRQGENAIYASIDSAEVRKKLNGASRGWVEVEGVFDTTVTGMSGCVPGAIYVERFGPWPRPGLFGP
jgi:hypothetical protein